ncbi:MAG: hypothetical protein U5L04_06455 [Trueperaceae bacterium]|nr:hypothetical protein [Trueperaceae bacterium]
MSKLTIETDEHTIRRLEALAAILAQPQETLVSRALEVYLQELEEEVARAEATREQLAMYALPSWREDDLDDFLAYLREERQQSLQDEFAKQ